MRRLRVFLAFADGSADYQAAGRRIAREAARLKIFDQVIVYNFAKLRKDYPEFWSKNELFFSKNKRGAGYWVWKPFIIKETLKKLSEGDVIFYADAGCEIDGRLIDRIDDIDPNDCDMTLFELPLHTNETWTNALTLTTLGAERHVREADQLVATAVIVKNTSRSRSLINDWDYYCSASDHAYVIDRSDTEIAAFKEHRHDQSILSILARKSLLQGTVKIKVASYNFIDADGSGLRAKRNRTGYSSKVKSTYIYKRVRRVQHFVRRAITYALSFIRR